jgi:hypothetical protein
MENWPDLDPAAETEGRRLLAAALDTALAGTVLAGTVLDGTVLAGTVLAGTVLAGTVLADDELAGAELLRRQKRRRTARRRRVRALVPAGAVATLGGAAALSLALTATFAAAPSALAAVTAAAAKTSAESFRFSYTETVAVTGRPGFHEAPVQVTGVFDSRRGLGAETIKPYEQQIRIVGGHIYVKLEGSGFVPEFFPPTHGKPWLGSLLPSPRPVTNADLAAGTSGDLPIDPGALLGLLKSVASVQAEGAASGPGWTGTRYAFTERTTDSAGRPEAVNVTAYVDDQGRVRRLVRHDTHTAHPASGEYFITATTDVTFGGFGVRVSVTAPPASQVYALGQGWAVHLGEQGFIWVTGPRP